MTPDDDATTAKAPVANEIEESAREPWVAPALERLDLREAMGGGGPVGFDGMASS